MGARYRRIGLVAAGVAVALLTLAAVAQAMGLGRAAHSGNTSLKTPAAVAAGPTGAAATSAPTTTPASAPSSAPTSPTASAQPSVAPTIRLESYTNSKVLSGTQLFGIYAKPGTAIHAPIGGKVVVLAATDPGLPTGKVYGYVTITATDHTQVALFIGAVGVDVHLLVRDQDTLTAGAVVLEVIGGGPSVIYYTAKGVTPYQVMGYWRDPSGKYIDATSKVQAFATGSP